VPDRTARRRALGQVSLGHLDTSEICGAVRLLGRQYCASAAFDRLRTRPKKSSSHCVTDRPTWYTLPVNDWFTPDVAPEKRPRWKLALPFSVLGSRSARWIWYCARLLRCARGGAQVAVVFQRRRNQLLQARIGEELAPADIGRARVSPVFTRPWRSLPARPSRPPRGAGRS
jgi:hypothetical protein